MQRVFLATRENWVVRSHRRNRMRFNLPRGAADGPGIRITQTRGADVRTSFSRGCAAHRCSGRSLKCKPARPLNQMTISVRVNRRRSQAAVLATTQGHSPGRMAGGSGFSTAVKRTGFSLNCSSTLNPVGTSKSAAPVIDGRARLLVLSSAERLSVDADERKRRRVDSPHGL